MDVDLEFWFSFTSTLLYYAIYPILVIATWLFYLVCLIASPFIYLASIVKDVVSLPVRLLAKFEVNN